MLNPFRVLSGGGFVYHRFHLWLLLFNPVGVVKFLRTHFIVFTYGYCFTTLPHVEGL